MFILIYTGTVWGTILQFVYQSLYWVRQNSAVCLSVFTMGQAEFCSLFICLLGLVEFCCLTVLTQREGVGGWGRILQFVYVFTLGGV